MTIALNYPFHSVFFFRAIYVETLPYDFHLLSVADATPHHSQISTVSVANS